MWVPLVKPYLFLWLGKAHIPDPRSKSHPFAVGLLSLGQKFRVLLSLETYQGVKNIPYQKVISTFQGYLFLKDLVKSLAMNVMGLLTRA